MHVPNILRILEMSDDRVRARADGSAVFGQRNIIQKRLLFLRLVFYSACSTSKLTWPDVKKKKKKKKLLLFSIFFFTLQPFMKSIFTVGSGNWNKMKYKWTVVIWYKRINWRPKIKIHYYMKFFCQLVIWFFFLTIYCLTLMILMKYCLQLKFDFKWSIYNHD